MNRSRQEAEGIAIFLGLSDKILAHLRAGASEFTEGGDRLGVQGNGLSPDLVQSPITDDETGANDGRGEGSELGFLAHCPPGGLGLTDGAYGITSESLAGCDDRGSVDEGGVHFVDRAGNT